MAKKSHPLVVLFGDTHIGGLTALCPPQIELDDGGEYRASPIQKDLLAFWQDFWGKVWETAGRRDTIAVHMGDVVDGVVSQTTQSLPNLVDQEEAAIEVLQEVRDRAAQFHILRGTDAHVGQQAQSERRIAKRLGADSCPYHLSLWVGDIEFDLAHHGRVGGRRWTSAAAGVVSEIITEYSTLRRPPPRFIVRAHRHVIDDSGERHPWCRAFTTPAWQCKTSYAYKVAVNRLADIGGVVVDGEQVTFLRYYFREGRALRALTGAKVVRA